MQISILTWTLVATAIAMDSAPRISDVGIAGVVLGRQRRYGLLQHPPTTLGPTSTTVNMCRPGYKYNTYRHLCVIMEMSCPIGYKPNYNIGECVPKDPMNKEIIEKEYNDYYLYK